MTTSGIADPNATEHTGVDPRSADEQAIDKDDAFHILQNSRRRAVLRYVLERGEEQFDMRDVAEAVAAWEHGTTVSRLSSEERQRVYISLYQSHLPKLDDSGLIEYDQDRGVVVPRAPIALLEPFLDDGLHSDEDLVLDDADRPPGSEGPGGISSFLSRLRR